MKNILKVVRFIVSTGVLNSIFGAEASHGKGKGDDKLSEVLGGLGSLGNVIKPGVSGSDLAEAAKELIESLVDVLNALGILDNTPGYDIDLKKIVPAAVRLVKAVQLVADLFA